MKTNSDLAYNIKNNDLYISISMLLDQDDYDAIWKGENGADGYETETVSKIREIVAPFSKENGPDLQIWEEGNAFVQNLRPEALNEIKQALENAFNEKFELAETG
jgi:hypothetical protein